MSSPTEQQPYEPTNPWHGQQPPPAQPTPPYPPPYPPPNPPPYWQPFPAVPKQTNGLAIAAIVVSSLALLVGLGFVLSQVVFGVLLAGVMGSSGGFAPPDMAMKGTAPQVVAGQAYSGTLLKDEVTRVIRADLGGEVASMSCPATPAVVAGAVTECHGKVDGSDWSYLVTFEDGKGHFTLDEKLG